MFGWPKIFLKMQDFMHTLVVHLTKKAYLAMESLGGRNKKSIDTPEMIKSRFNVISTFFLLLPHKNLWVPHQNDVNTRF
jgi:hypothetical protein